MAPEVLSESHYGRKGDIWAVGCTMIQMLSGDPPWKDRNLQGLIQLHMLLSTWVGVPSFTPKEALSKEMSQCLEACFQRQMEDRPTASSLLQFPLFQQWNAKHKRVVETSPRTRGEDVEHGEVESLEESHTLNRLREQMERAAVSRGSGLSGQRVSRSAVRGKSESSTAAETEEDTMVGIENQIRRNEERRVQRRGSESGTEPEVIPSSRGSSEADDRYAVKPMHSDESPVRQSRFSNNPFGTKASGLAKHSPPPLGTVPTEPPVRPGALPPPREAQWSAGSAVSVPSTARSQALTPQLHMPHPKAATAPPPGDRRDRVDSWESPSAGASGHVKYLANIKDQAIRRSHGSGNAETPRSDTSEHMSPYVGSHYDDLRSADSRPYATRTRSPSPSLLPDPRTATFGGSNASTSTNMEYSEDSGLDGHLPSDISPPREDPYSMGNKNRSTPLLPSAVSGSGHSSASRVQSASTGVRGPSPNKLFANNTAVSKSVVVSAEGHGRGAFLSEERSRPSSSTQSTAREDLPVNSWRCLWCNAIEDADNKFCSICAHWRNTRPPSGTDDDQRISLVPAEPYSSGATKPIRGTGGAPHPSSSTKQTNRTKPTSRIG